MITGMILLLIVMLVAAGAMVMWGIATYNGFLAGRTACRNAFAAIDVHLQRYHDLIPGWVEMAGTCMKHERETLEAVLTARAAAVSTLVAAKALPGDPQAMAQLAAAESQLRRALDRLMTVAESYPELMTDPTMLQWTADVTAAEAEITSACMAYNAAATNYNTRREGFPASLLARDFAAAALLDLKPAIPRGTVEASHA